MMSGAKKRVPKRRFKEFLNAGEWEQRKLSELATMNARIGWQNLRTSEFLDSGDYLLITGTDFDNGRVKYSTCHYVEKKRFDQDTKIQLSTGSILITKDGTLGKVALVEELPKPATLNAGVFNVRVKDDAVLSYKYLYHYLKAPFLMKYVTANATGGTIKHLNQSILVDFPIPITEKPEQDRIAKLLDSLESSITLHQRKLDKLQATKKALLQEMFPEEGQDKPKRRFKGFTDAWEQRKLGDIATFSKGNGYSKSDLVPSGNPIILYGRLYTNYETTISNVDTFVELKDKSVLSQGGEVIVPASGETAEDISRASVVKNQGIIIGGDLNVIKANHLLDPTFLALTISNGGQQKELSKRAQGKSVVHLHNSDLQEVNLTFPLLNEQKEISTLFEKMDNIITLHQRKLDKLKNLKQAYLNEMFV
mgnify:FL=1